TRVTEVGASAAAGAAPSQPASTPMITSRTHQRFIRIPRSTSLWATSGRDSATGDSAHPGRVRSSTVGTVDIPEPLPPGSTRPEGWIAGQARQNLDGFLGSLPEISPEVGGRVFAAGRLGPGSTAENVGAVQWWNGESEGNWLHGYAGHVRLVGTEQERA